MDVNASIASVNECLRHITWVKSDLAGIRQKSGSQRTQQSQPNGNFSFGFHERQPQAPTTSNTSESTKRRIDVLATPQCAEVVRYVLSFNDDSCEVLEMLWSIADGPFFNEDLDTMRTFVKMLRMDASLASLELKPEEKE